MAARLPDPLTPQQAKQRARNERRRERLRAEGRPEHLDDDVKARTAAWRLRTAETQRAQNSVRHKRNNAKLAAYRRGEIEATPALLNYIRAQTVCKRRFAMRRLPPKRQRALYLEIVAAVPRTYPRAMRDDVIAAVNLALFDGKIRVRDIAAGVRIATTEYNRLYTKFGVVSLDAIVPGTDNLRLIDTIAAPEQELGDAACD